MKRLQTDGCISVAMIAVVLIMGIAAIAIVVTVFDLMARATIR